MATSEADTDQKRRIIIHGNIGFESDEFLALLTKNEKAYFQETKEFDFFPFSNLNPTNKVQSLKPNSEMKNLIEHSGQGVEVSAILVLISQTEIFSDGMHKIIQKLPQGNFYGFNTSNEKEWWSHVIVVFLFGKNDSKNVSHVGSSIKKNGGIKDIVKKAGDRYFWITNQTKSEELIEKLTTSMLLLKGKLTVGETHSEGYQELAQSFQKNFPDSSVVCTGGNLDHNFILIGERKSGKSSLSNLLLGPRYKPLFETEWYYDLYGKEKRYLAGFADVEIERVYPNKWKGDNPLKMKIVDGPDCFNPKLYGEFLAGCIPELRRTTFLILINLSSGSLSHQEFNKITDISRIFSFSNEDLFSKSMIVFTHVDELSENNEDPEQILRKLLLTKTYLYVHKLINLVNQRYIWINGTNINLKNRNEVLRKLFQVFTSETQKDKSKNDYKTVKDGQLNGDALESRLTTQGRNFTKFPILSNYQDMANALQKLLKCDQVRKIELLFSLNDIEIEMREVLKVLKRIGSTKVRVIMINFEEKRTQEICNKLLYIFKNEEFWKYALIAFTIQSGREYWIIEEIPKRFEVLVDKVNSRYVYLIDGKLNNDTEKDKSPLNQKREKSTHLDVNGGDSKVFFSQTGILSSNEPHEILFSYFILDEIAD